MSAKSFAVSKRRNRIARIHVGDSRIASVMKDFTADESGATAIEYSLLVALIFLAIVGAVNNFTNTTSDMYNKIDETLQAG